MKRKVKTLYLAFPLKSLEHSSKSPPNALKTLGFDQEFLDLQVFRRKKEKN